MTLTRIKYTYGNIKKGNLIRTKIERETFLKTGFTRKNLDNFLYSITYTFFSTLKKNNYLD